MGLKVIGVDFPSHRALPRNNEINFFQENDISALKLLLNKL
jgi:hypothetical protein